MSGTSTNNLTLTHDALGHLTAATGTGTVGSWAYGNYDDNLASASSNGGPTTTYVYSTTTNPNELATTSTSGVTTYYGYDQSGNTTSISTHSTNTCPTDSSSTCLSYDAAGRLSTVTTASDITATMTYNAAGQRATYTATGTGMNVSEHFQYRGGQLAQMTMTGTTRLLGHLPLPAGWHTPGTAAAERGHDHPLLV